MLWMRSKVAVKKTDLTSLEKYKHPLFPGMRYAGSAWKWDTTWASDFEQSFMNFVGYAPVRPKPGIVRDDGPAWDFEGTESRRDECASGGSKCAHGTEDSIEVKKEKNYNNTGTDLSHFNRQLTLQLPAVGDPTPAGSYDIIQDWMGPLYWAPNQCIRQTSWHHPKKTSPIIGVVDRQNDL